MDQKGPDEDEEVPTLLGGAKGQVVLPPRGNGGVPSKRRNNSVLRRKATLASATMARAWEGVTGRAARARR